MKDILKTYTTLELKKFISQSNIKRYSKLKKNELIELMTKSEHVNKFKHIKEKGKSTITKSELQSKRKAVMKKDTKQPKKKESNEEFRQKNKGEFGFSSDTVEKNKGKIPDKKIKEIKDYIKIDNKLQAEFIKKPSIESLDKWINTLKTNNKGFNIIINNQIKNLLPDTYGDLKGLNRNLEKSLNEKATIQRKNNIYRIDMLDFEERFKKMLETKKPLKRELVEYDELIERMRVDKKDNNGRQFMIHQANLKEIVNNMKNKGKKKKK